MGSDSTNSTGVESQIGTPPACLAPVVSKAEGAPPSTDPHTIYAHTLPASEAQWEPLDEYQRRVAALAERFAEAFAASHGPGWRGYGTIWGSGKRGFDQGQVASNCR